MNNVAEAAKCDPVWSAYRMLSTTLHRRHLGLRGFPAPDWIDPVAINAVALPLGQPNVARTLNLSVCDGVSIAALPRVWTHQGGEVHLDYVRAPRLQAQSTPMVSRENTPRLEGTATCLVRDRLNPDRYYLITCGHVAAPTIQAHYGESVLVKIGEDVRTARLREWMPVVGGTLPILNIDAALLEVEVSVTHLIRQSANTWLPAGIGNDIRRDLPISLCRHDGPIGGAMRVHWSGKVAIPDGDELPDYFLDDAIGYTTLEPTRPGDSGAPVWSADNLLVGMHIGAIEAAGAFGANAVFGRISPVLDWFQVKAFTRSDPASLDVEDRPGEAPRLNLPPGGELLDPKAGELTTFAQTLWGEARGEGVEGMEAVACVIMNRFRTRYRGRDSVAAVCLDPKQFSCWLRGDPNRRKLEQIVRTPDATYLEAEQIAARALKGGLIDVTQGARHYYATTMSVPPDWARGKIACFSLGRHLFFNDVA